MIKQPTCRERTGEPPKARLGQLDVPPCTGVEFAAAFRRARYGNAEGLLHASQLPARLADRAFPLLVLAACIAAGVWYLRADWSLARGRSWKPRRTAAFFAGLVSVDLALQSPVATLTATYFEAHVLQHLLLMIIAPAFLAMGAPMTLILQTSSRRAKSVWLRTLHSNFFAVLSHPLVVWFLYYGTMLAFFLTPLIGFAMNHMWLMDLINLGFLFGGTLFWWPMIGLDPIPRWGINLSSPDRQPPDRRSARVVPGHRPAQLSPADSAHVQPAEQPLRGGRPLGAVGAAHSCGSHPDLLPVDGRRGPQDGSGKTLASTPRAHGCRRDSSVTIRRPPRWLDRLPTHRTVVCSPAGASSTIGGRYRARRTSPRPGELMAEMTVFENLDDEVKASAGRDLGHSDWLEITQDRINLFADATDDHQWIHVDPERAASGPFGRTIAHGYLTLSLVAGLTSQLIEVHNIKMAINYGTNKVRFPSPVPVGSRIRASARILSVEDVPGGAQVTNLVTVEVEGSEKPCCVVESIVRYLA